MRSQRHAHSHECRSTRNAANADSDWERSLFLICSHRSYRSHPYRQTYLFADTVCNFYKMQGKETLILAGPVMNFFEIQLDLINEKADYDWAVLTFWELRLNIGSKIRDQRNRHISSVKCLELTRSAARSRLHKYGPGTIRILTNY